MGDRLLGEKDSQNSASSSPCLLLLCCLFGNSLRSHQLPPGPLRQHRRRVRSHVGRPASANLPPPPSPGRRDAPHSPPHSRALAGSPHKQAQRPPPVQVPAPSPPRTPAPIRGAAVVANHLPSAGEPVARRGADKRREAGALPDERGDGDSDRSAPRSHSANGFEVRGPADSCLEGPRSHGFRARAKSAPTPLGTYVVTVALASRLT